jgi:DNA-binding GntR family transcriptional regulator
MTNLGPDADELDEPLRRRRGALLVHEQLREDILWLRLAPGSALDEVMLAKTFGVSRTPIREALLLLANEGFVHFLQNRTTIVAPLTMDNLAAYLDTFILLSRGLIRAATLNGLAQGAALDPYLAAFAGGLDRGDHEMAFRAQLDLYRAVAGLAQNQFLGKYFLEAQDASVRTKLLFFFPDAGGDPGPAVGRSRCRGCGSLCRDPVRDAGDPARDGPAFRL